MNIHFIYVQKKENLEEFIFIFRKRDEKIESIYLNKKIYSILYNDDTNDDINYIKLFYIKKGLVINFNDDIWNKIIHLNYKNLGILKLIDRGCLSTVKHSSCLYFDYKQNKNEMDDIIIEAFLLDK
jgi:hypothetical protein